MPEEKVSNIELDRVAFGERLKEARNRKGYTQNELSEITGISKIMISSYENPNSKSSKNPTLNNVYMLANALDVSIDYLCGNKPKMTYADVFNFFLEYDKLCKISINVIDLTQHDTVVSNYFHTLSEFTQNFIENRNSYIDGVPPINSPFINFGNNDFDKILIDWLKIKNLVNDGTLDDEIYKIWLNNTLKKCVEIPVESKLYNVEDDLPF